MKYERFEDLPVWSTAQDLARRVFALTRRPLFAQPGDLRDQVRRAALSVSNNIAEGFERGSTAELLAFLYIARGSAGEIRSMLRFAVRLLDDADAAAPDAQRGLSGSEISNLRSEISNLRSAISGLIPLAESCSRQIRAWADKLQNTDIQGQRHLNERTRHAYDAAHRADAFRDRVREDFRRSHPELFSQSEDGQSDSP
jgi:four helix bundle protein